MRKYLSASGDKCIRTDLQTTHVGNERTFDFNVQATSSHNVLGRETRQQIGCTNVVGEVQLDGGKEINFNSSSEQTFYLRQSCHLRHTLYRAAAASSQAGLRHS
jgi:hypothetical protein